MKSLINYLGALAAFLVLGTAMSFIEWISQFEVLGWIGLGLVFTIPFYLAVKFWKSLE